MNGSCDSTDLNAAPTLADLRERDLLVLFQPGSLRQFSVETHGKTEIMIGAPLAEAIFRAPASVTPITRANSAWPLDFDIE